MNNNRSIDILLKGLRSKKDLLYIFSSYVASDPDFKYNDTYLTDQINSFFNDYIYFIEKRNVFNKIKDYIKHINQDNYKIEILFDESFYYTNNEEQKEYRMNIPLLKNENHIMLKLTASDGNRLIESSYEVKKNSSMQYEWKSDVDTFIEITEEQMSNKNATKDQE